MQESLKRHCQDEENAGSGRHGQADIFFLHRNGDESTPEVSLHYPLHKARPCPFILILS